MRRKRRLIAIATMPAKGWTREDPAAGGGASGGGAPSTTDSGDSGDTNPEGEQKPAEGKAPTITGDFDPERAARALKAAREGEAKAKASAQAERDRVTAILKAAGLTPDGKEDPEAKLKALADDNAKLRDTAAAYELEKAVRGAAGKHGGDFDALNDSRDFATKLGALDPSAADYADKVSDLVKAAVKDQPQRYAAQKPAPNGRGRGTDHTGGGGTGRPQGLGAAIAARMTT